LLILNVNIAETKRAKTYHLHPKQKIIFCLFSFKTCLFDLQCNGSADKEREFGTAFQNMTRASRGISIPKHLYMLHKFECWNHSLQHEGA